MLNNAHASASEENSSHDSAYPANSERRKKENLLERANQAYRRAIEEKKQQFLGQQAGPPIGSKEYLKQFTDKVAAETASGDKELLLPVALEQGAVLTLVAAPEVAAAAAPAAQAGFGYLLTHSNEATEFAQGAVNGLARAPRTRAGTLGGIVNAIIRYFIH